MKHLRIESKWGFILFLIQLVWFFLERVLGFHGERIDNYFVASQFFALPYTYIYYRALKEKRTKAFRGFMSYDKALATGLRLTFFIVLLTPLSQWLLINLISPNFLENLRVYSIEAQLYSDERATEMYNSGRKIIEALVFNVVIGVLTSLVISLFTYRKIEIE